MSQDETYYSSEYAKSDRSQCRLCKNCIGMGSLRLAIYVQSPFFDGKMAMWYHQSCFFKKTTPKDVSTIRGFQSLRWEDQQKIKEKMGLTSGSVGAAAKTEDDEDDEDSNESIESAPSNYSVEYSKSNRSLCKKCEKKIEKDAVRITMKVPKSSLNGNYHLDCFAKNKKSLGYTFPVDELVGLDDLSKEDKKAVEDAFKSSQEAEETKAKRKLSDEESENDDENVDPEAKRLKKEQRDKQNQLKNQAKEFWKLRDTLDKELATETIRELLESNEQNLGKAGRDDALNLLCDCMYFGPLKKCPECKDGQLYYRDTAYKCSGNITEWTKCRYKTQDPARASSFSIDADLKSEFACLKSFKFQPRRRIFEKTFDEIEQERADAKTNAKSREPLAKLSFSSTSKLNRNNKQLKALVERLGGVFSSQVGMTTVAVISNKEEVEKKLKKVRDCEACEVYMVDEAICDELEKPLNQVKMPPLDIEALILKHNITPWTPADLKQRMRESVEANEVKKSAESEKQSFALVKSSAVGGDGSGKIKMKVKGGAVVDPDSGLEDDAHVLVETRSNEPYSCVLGMVDITRGSNSFYKLQILEHDKARTCYVFRSWGRVGTTIGGNKLETFSDKNGAIRTFEYLYKDKTGNDWSDRKFASKVPGKFYPLEMDYGEDNDKSDQIKSIDKNLVSKSSLAHPIQSLIRLIFDVDAMKAQMKEFEIDLNKMPLGKISSNQIKKAFNVLTELTSLIDKMANSTSESLILDACNRFYTLIPHDFGLKKPTILNKKELIKEKTDMLNNLLEIEIAFNILNTGGDSKTGGEVEDPIDVHYKKLKCHMEVLDRDSDEFKHILEYVKNTHAKTHSGYALHVEDVFKICREGEDSSFDKYRALHNRKLLWHGSRLTNFAGILSQGLRIAPPEAPSTGYMFGKGVYFADMVSKSANYCFTNSSNPTGLMLLCEVALGDMYERTNAEYVTKLPAGKHSTKGVGRTAPDPKKSYVTPDGLEIPVGKGVDTNVNNSALLYNEYIVYDTAQIRMKYLLRINFKYSY